MSVNFEHGKILQGDVLEKLKEIPSESVDCVITSPPYWGLRDYSIDGQWGLESDFKDYLMRMSQFMIRLKRVLKNTGTVWINLGDTYSASPVGSFNQGGKEGRDMSGIESSGKLDKTKSGIFPKSRFGIPERFYIQCIDSGWIARNHIPWIKENSMPSSVKDRFTNKWESIFFFAKEQKYYFNLDAVRVKPKTETKSFNVRVRDAKKGLGQLKLGDNPKAWKMSEQEDEDYNEKGERKQDNTLGSDGKPLANYKGFNFRWSEKTRKHFDENGNCLGCGKSATQHTVTNRAQGSENRDERQKDAIVWCNPKGKNPGDVFNINPRPFPEAHFATFPVDLPLKILKCACPNQVCKNCGKPRNPISKATPEYQKILDMKPASNADSMKRYSGLSADKLSNNCLVASYEIVGWTDCGCNAGFEAGIVLDPFFGAGTVGLAAEKLSLNWMGIELSLEYVKIATKRLEPHNIARLVEWM